MRTVTGPTDHVVIVGAGLAGLSTALRLLGAGRRVTVLEREPVPGGRAGRIETPAPDGSGTYTFDTGPTVLTMPDLIADALDCVDERLEDWLDLIPLDPVYRSYYPDGSTLDVKSDVDAMAAEVERVCGPDEAGGYLRYVEFTRELYRLEMRDFIDRNIDSPLDLARPSLARLAAIGGFRRLAPKVNDYLKDPRTRRVLSFQAMYAGLSPQQALAIYAVIAYMDSVAGVYFPRGGMHQLPLALAGAATKHGAEIRCSTTVDRVLTRNGRATGVVTTEGEHITADVVVLNPDLPVAYRDLLPPSHTPKRLARLDYSPSCVLLHVGSSATYTKTAHHNIHFGKAWAGVFDDLIQRQTLMTDPSILVTNHSHSDPSQAPPGRQTYYVLAPTPHTGAGIDWASVGPRYRDEIVATLEARGYIGFDNAVEVEHLVTPADWEASGLAMGAPFAASHSFFQTGPFRPSNLAKGLENVVFTGSGTQPGVGVPMVLVSGRLAAERVTGPDRSYRSRALTLAR